MYTLYRLKFGFAKRFSAIFRDVTNSTCRLLRRFSIVYKHIMYISYGGWDTSIRKLLYIHDWLDVIDAITLTLPKKAFETSLKKFTRKVSDADAASWRRSALNWMYSLTHGDWLNWTIRCILLQTIPNWIYNSRFFEWTRYFFLSHKFGTSFGILEHGVLFARWKSDSMSGVITICWGARG